LRAIQNSRDFARHPKQPGFWAFFSHLKTKA